MADGYPPIYLRGDTRVLTSFCTLGTGNPGARCVTLETPAIKLIVVYITFAGHYFVQRCILYFAAARSNLRLGRPSLGISHPQSVVLGRPLLDYWTTGHLMRKSKLVGVSRDVVRLIMFFNYGGYLEIAYKTLTA